MSHLLKHDVIEAVEKGLARLGVEDVDAADRLETPPALSMGDYAFPCFQLAPVLRRSPQEIAIQLAQAMESKSSGIRVEAVSAYVNIHLERATSVQKVVEGVLAAGSQYGDDTVGRGKTVALDYSAPNIAKPFHIGHLRSTIIGHSLGRIFRTLGYDIVRINHLGDWGTQFGKLIAAYRLWGDEAKLEEEPIKELVRLYVRFHEQEEKDPQLEAAGRAAFKALEDGGEEETRIWRRFRDLSLTEFERLYERLDVTFDSELGESAYNAQIEAVVAQLDEAGLLTESDGALVVELPDMPACLIKKQDGATLYATRDLAAALHRYQTYEFDHMLYVVGAPQQLHFRQVFAVLDRLGLPWVERCEHIAFGHIRLGDQQLSTRRGRVIYLDELLDHAVARVRAIIAERNPDLEHPEEVAEMVGVGAVIFNDLFHNRIKDIVFDWDEVLNFEGDTGPYVQYTHARAASLLKRGSAADDTPAKDQALTADAFTDEESFVLAKGLAEYPDVIARAAQEREPSEIARYLVALCRQFNSFYHARRIIGESFARERLALTAATKQVIANGLYLLGIEAPDSM